MKSSDARNSVHDGAFLATVDSSYKHYEKILTKSMIQHKPWIYRRMGNLSASQKLKKKKKEREKKKKTPCNTTQLATEGAN